MTGFRGYTISNRAWYKHVVIEDEIMFGIYHDDGGSSGEMSITWIDLMGKKTPKLEAFNDSWKILSDFSDVISELSELSGDVTQDDVVRVLKNCGFKDITAYQR